MDGNKELQNVEIINGSADREKTQEAMEFLNKHDFFTTPLNYENFFDDEYVIMLFRNKKSEPNAVAVLGQVRDRCILYYLAIKKELYAGAREPPTRLGRLFESALLQVIDYAEANCPRCKYLRYSLGMRDTGELQGAIREVILSCNFQQEGHGTDRITGGSYSLKLSHDQ